jgi:hypothetical protein
MHLGHAVTKQKPRFLLSNIHDDSLLETESGLGMNIYLSTQVVGGRSAA